MIGLSQGPLNFLTDFDFFHSDIMNAQAIGLFGELIKHLFLLLNIHSFADACM